MVLSLQIGQGTGDFVNPGRDNPGYVSISRDTRGQIEGGAEFWYRFTEDYAFNVSAAYGAFQETNQPGVNAPANSYEVSFKTSGYKVRIGGDRMVDLGHRLTFFAGPGFQWWSGKGTYKNIYTPRPSSVDSPTSTRYAISGRVGSIMALTPTVGLVGRVGATFGYATAQEAGAKATWWPVGFESAWGVSYTFGGE
jgi:hypothetical protein